MSNIWEFATRNIEVLPLEEQVTNMMDAVRSGIAFYHGDDFLQTLRDEGTRVRIIAPDQCNGASDHWLKGIAIVGAEDGIYDRVDVRKPWDTQTEVTIHSSDKSGGSYTVSFVDQIMGEKPSLLREHLNIRGEEGRTDYNKYVISATRTHGKEVEKRYVRPTINNQLLQQSSRPSSVDLNGAVLVLFKPMDI